MKLSICCITYNHEAFIAQAIESFVMQQTNFDFEIVIHDDASTDGTAAIVAEYADRYPHKIRATLHSQNSGMMQNFVNCLGDCRGEFLAFCEGDDYWIDPLKLQKQVDFLEQSPDISLCYHQPIRKQSDGRLEYPLQAQSEIIYSDFIDIPEYRHFLTSCCVVFRNNFSIPDWVLAAPVGDIPLFYLCSQGGDFVCLPDLIAVYRIHNNGSWTGLNRLAQLKKLKKLYKVLLPHTSGKIRNVLLRCWRVNIEYIAANRYPNRPFKRIIIRTVATLLFDFTCIFSKFKRVG